MTEEQLCNLVLEASGKTEKELPRFRIIALGKLAIHRLASLLAAAKDEPFAQALRQLVREDVDVTVTNGVGDLTGVKGQAEPILAEQIATSEVYFSGITRRGQYVPDRSAVNRDRMPGWPFFTVSGDFLIVRYNGTSPDCTATIRGPVVKSLANIPATQVDKFVQLVAFMATPAGEAALAAQEAMTAKEGE